MGGDAFVDVVTDEDKAILAGEEPKPPAPDAEKDELGKKGPEPEAKPEGEKLPEGEKVETEPTEAEKNQQKQAEEMGLEVVTDEKTGKQYVVDEDGKRIPPTRFREIYREAKEGERTKDKLDLFKKLGPEGYYRAYPEERPEMPMREATREAMPPVGDIGALVVRHPGGQYDGMTLRDVYAIDPVFATALQTDFLWTQKQESAKRAGAFENLRNESKTEIETFAESIAKESFGKSAKELSKDEEGKIVETIQKVLNFMTKTGRGSGIMEDAYFLMNKEGLLKKAAETASRGALRSLTERKGPASIDTSGGGSAKETGFEAVANMTEQQLVEHIDSLDDKAMTKFLKEAPKSIRAKLPGMPWKTAA